MNRQDDEKHYFFNRRAELLSRFDEDAERWKQILLNRYEADFTDIILKESRVEFETLIPQIPYIGGDQSWTGSLVGSVRCLAFFQAMKKHDKTPEETGRILYDAILVRMDEPQRPIPSIELLTPGQLMERRKKRAEMSRKQRYAGGYVCQFVPGDGVEFDYGYDFFECAARKFYHARGADEFLPFYCYLDFPSSKVFGLGLTRTMSLAEGHDKCNHRFKSGRGTEVEWPPPFLKQE